MNKKDIHHILDNITDKISSEESTVTTFTLSSHSIRALDWLVKFHKISKQKLFEMIIDNNSFIDILHKINDSSHIIRKNDSAPVKQRIAKKYLNKTNVICKKYNISRDQLLDKALTILYEDHTSKIKKNISATKKALEKIDKLQIDIANCRKYIKNNKHLEKAYSNSIDLIMDNMLSLKKSIKYDINNFNLHQWSYLDDKI